MHFKSCLISVGIASNLMATAANAQSLIGATIEFGAYYPTPSSPISNKVSATVGDNIEFTSIGNLNLAGYVVADADVDISASQIYIDYSWSGASASGGFNGYVFNFSNLGGQKITGVSLASSTTLPLNNIGLSFDADSVLISLPGTTVSPSSILAVDVQVASVPEPAAFALFVVGGVVLLASRGGKQRTSA